MGKEKVGYRREQARRDNDSRAARQASSARWSARKSADSGSKTPDQPKRGRGK